MTRRGLAYTAVAVVVLLAVAAALFLPGYLEQRAAREAIVAYDEALSRALADLDPDALNAVAVEREVGKVANYVTLLWGTNTTMDASLLGLEVIEFRSEDPTITVTVAETWEYEERDKESGLSKGPAVTEEQVIEYVLVPGDSGLIVWSTLLIEDGEER